MCRPTRSRSPSRDDARQGISCVVPDERKAVAVQMALKSEISTACAATILRSTDCVLWRMRSPRPCSQCP